MPKVHSTFKGPPLCSAFEQGYTCFGAIFGQVGEVEQLLLALAEHEAHLKSFHGTMSGEIILGLFELGYVHPKNRGIFHIFPFIIFIFWLSP
jgi:hypothetical protein